MAAIRECRVALAQRRCRAPCADSVRGLRRRLGVDVGDNDAAIDRKLAYVCQTRRRVTGQISSNRGCRVRSGNARDLVRGRSGGRDRRCFAAPGRRHGHDQRRASHRARDAVHRRRRLPSVPVRNALPHSVQVAIRFRRPSLASKAMRTRERRRSVPTTAVRVSHAVPA